MVFGIRKKPRVLVLDDDVSMQKLVSMILKREGLRVDVVGSGRKAIEAIEGKNEYAAILLDLMMPTEGGMTVIGHVRESKPALLQRPEEAPHRQPVHPCPAPGPAVVGLAERRELSHVARVRLHSVRRVVALFRQEGDEGGDHAGTPS